MVEGDFLFTLEVLKWYKFIKGGNDFPTKDQCFM